MLGVVADIVPERPPVEIFVLDIEPIKRIILPISLEYNIMDSGHTDSS
jgi:hypothetical protein